MSLKAGKEALLRKRYTEAIAILLEYCKDHPNPRAKDYIQAQLWLSSAYQHTGRADKAILICEELGQSADPQLQAWSKKLLITLRRQLEAQPDKPVINTDVTSVVADKPNRYRKKNVTLAIPLQSKLAYIGTATLTTLLPIALVFGFFLWVVSLFTLSINAAWLNIVYIATVITVVLLFFMSPWLIEITQKQFQRIQWITLADLDEKSPETVEVIENFCQTHKIDVPRLGFIEDDNPTAFIYGILPNSTRLVVSRGLFNYLDDDEIAAVCAHQLARIANWSFSIITFASVPVQLTYLLYVSLSRIGYKAKRAKNGWKFLAAIAYLIHNISTYLLVGLTRSSTTLNDCFAAEVTGNPNALSRALVKIARGVAMQNQLGQPPSRLLESTRALNITDYRTTTTVGIAFEVLHSGQSVYNVYKVFLWELFNPWGRWLELHSTHPLIGKRIEALTKYSRQLGLRDEYEFSQLLKEGKALSRARLFKNFNRDLLLQLAPYLGVVIGITVAYCLYWIYNNWLPSSLALMGLGIGLMFKGSIKYPDFRKVADTDLVSLLIDPYASTVHGTPVQIPGEIVGYGNAKSKMASYDLKLSDQAGIMYLNYIPSMKAVFENPMSTIQQLESSIDESVLAIGWFRRGETPVVDLANLQFVLTDKQGKVRSLKSYHQDWDNLLSSTLVLVGLLILLVTSFL